MEVTTMYDIRAMLNEGNKRFIETSDSDLRKKTAEHGQHPYAIVICCSDASSSMIDENRCRLSENYILPGTEEQGRVTFLMNKKEMACLAVETGAWPLYRYNPQLDNPMQLDTVHAKRPLSDYLARENRFQILAKTQPERATHLLQQAQTAVHQRIAFYQKLANCD